MKRTVVFLVILLVALLTGTLSATLLLYDDFTGLTPGNLAGQSSWTKGGTGPDCTVANTAPITYSGYNGGGSEYVAIPASGTTSRVYKGYTTTAVGTNTFYYSFLLNVSSCGATSSYFITLGDAGTNTGYAGRLYAKSSGTGYVLGASKSSATATYATTPTVLSFGTTYVVVVRYTGVTGTVNDQVYMWINPSLASEPSTGTAEVTVPASENDPTLNSSSFGNFHWHNRTTSNPVGAFDAVRVAYGATSAAAWTDLAAGQSLATEPTAQPSVPQFSNTTSTSYDVAFTAASPTANGYIAIRKAGSAPTTDPADGTAYTAGTTLGDGVVAYSGSGVTFPESSLNPSTTYYYKFYSYNGSGSTTNYLITSPLEGNHATSAGVVLPTVTVSAVTSIGSITATGNGEVTADGGGTVTDRGICWNTSTLPTTGDFSASGGSGVGVFTAAMASLTPNQLYYVRAYATNSAGTAYSASEVTFTTYKAEPANHVTAFTAGTPTTFTIPLTWTNSIGGADGYLIKGSDVGYGSILAPSDGVPEVDAALVKNVTDGSGAYTFTSLSSGVAYYFNIYPYNNATTHIDYKVDGTVQQVTATTVATPILTALPATLTFNAYAGNTTGPLIATVTSANLSAGITVASTGPFTFSETSGGTYSNPLELATNYTGSVYVKFAPPAANAYTDPITFTSGVTTATINPTATGYALPTSTFMMENFDYTTGTVLTAITPNPVWFQAGSAASPNVAVVTPGLTYTGYPGTGIGNAAYLNSSGQDIYGEGSTAVNFQTMYAAFMINLETVQGTGDYFAALLPDNSTTNFALRFYAKPNGSQYQLGVTKSNETPVNYATDLFNLGTTYVVVLKYEFVPTTTTDDIMTVYAFNATIPTTEPTTPLITYTNSTKTDSPNIKRFVLRQGSSSIAPKLKIDGIRMAYSWDLLFPTATAEITVTSSFTPFNTVQGNPSASQAYQVSGTNLLDNIDITAPTGYELSTTDTDPWTSTLSLAPSYRGTVHVRLTGTTAGTFNGNLVHTSSGALPVNTPVTGQVTAPSGYISVTEELTPFTTFTGTPSPSPYQTYTLSGHNLNDFLHIATMTTAGADFEVRDALGDGTWHTDLQLSDTFDGTIEVRFNPTVSGEYAGTITHYSDGVTDVVINVSGTAIDPTPSLVVTPPTMTFSVKSGLLSDPQIATVTSANLTNPIDIASTGEYVFCTTEGGTYTNPLQVAANYNGSIYIKFAPTSIGTFSNSITFTSGVTTDDISTTGYGLDPNATYASDLFISEYVEGSSNNKALEIFNGTGHTVNLADYRIELRGFGGSTNPGNPFTNTQPLTGTLANNDAYVIVNSSAGAPLLALADLVSTSVCSFNGDDAVVIVKVSDNSLVDIFGVIGDDPGTVWTDGVYSSINQTLIRKPSVYNGITVNPSGTGPLAFTTLFTEWDKYDTDTFSNLGIHTFYPGATAAVEPAILPVAGAYYAPITVTMSTTTPGAQIRYTTDGNDPTDTSTLYVAGGFSVSSTTTVKARTYATGYAPSSISSAHYIFPTDVSTIAALRAITPGDAYYRLTSEAVITMLGTGSSYKVKYIQDATGAVMIYDANPGKITTSYSQWDGITNLVCQIKSYNGMIELIPALDPGAATSSGNTITPEVITLAQLNTTYQAHLVRINNVSFAATGTFANYVSYTITDPSSTGIVYLNYTNLDYLTTTIPTTPKDIVGVVLQTVVSSVPVTQFVPRSLADFFDSAPPTPPDAPINPSITVVGNDVVLSWTDNNLPVVTSWKVYSSDAPNGSYTLRGTYSTNPCTLIGEAPTYGKRFYYVKAVR